MKITEKRFLLASFFAKRSSSLETDLGGSRWLISHLFSWQRIKSGSSLQRSEYFLCIYAHFLRQFGVCVVDLLALLETLRFEWHTRAKVVHENILYGYLTVSIYDVHL